MANRTVLRWPVADPLFGQPGQDLAEGGRDELAAEASANRATDAAD
ncbi:hypothetical protein [Actinomadura sp. 9N215]